VNINAEHKEN